MTLEQFLAFSLFAFVAAVTPGPSNVMLVSAGAASGFWRGLPCLFGVVLGMGLMLLMVSLGIGGLVLEHPQALTVMRVLGATFLLWLAWKIATSPPPQAGTAAPVGFLAAAAFQWINPKSWLVSTSAAGTYLNAEAAGPILQATLLGATFCIAALPAGLLWLALGAKLQTLLRTPAANKVFNRTMGLLLACSVVLILW